MSSDTKSTGSILATPELAALIGVSESDLPHLLKRLYFFATGATNEADKPLFARRGSKAFASAGPAKPRAAKRRPKEKRPAASTSNVPEAAAARPFAGLRDALALAGSS